jgi:hypothetical protein
MLDPMSQRRFNELVALVRQRIERLTASGGDILLKVRIERGGRLSRLSKLTVDEYPLTAGSEEAQTKRT